MSTNTTPLAGPISRDWTVRHLLGILAEDIDVLPLDALLAVEAGLLERSASAAAPWTNRPHAIAVIRSIAALTRLDRTAGQLTLGELGIVSLDSAHVVERRSSNTRARHGAQSPTTHSSGDSSRTFDTIQPTLS